MGGVQVIFTGDFFQLPPVRKGNENDLFYNISHQQQQRCDNTQVIMTQGMTQNQNIINGSAKREYRFCFESTVWNELFAKEDCFALNEIHRQKDISFSSLLNAIRWGECNGKNTLSIHNCYLQNILLFYLLQMRYMINFKAASEKNLIAVMEFYPQKYLHIGEMLIN
jgi:hypothetical protein